MTMRERSREQKCTNAMLESRFADLVQDCETQRILRARSMEPDLELVERMRNLTEEGSVARSFLDKAIAEIRPSWRKE